MWLSVSPAAYNNKTMVLSGGLLRCLALSIKLPKAYTFTSAALINVFKWKL